MSDTCTIEPVTDDMAICHPSFQKNSGKLALADGEDGWFVRVDGITEYGCDPMYEKIAIHPRSRWCSSTSRGAPGHLSPVGAHNRYHRQALSQPTGHHPAPDDSQHCLVPGGGGRAPFSACGCPPTRPKPPATALGA